MRKIIWFVLVWVCILMVHTPVKAEINYNLLYNWSFQPSNVQMDLVQKHTDIQVVDQLDWTSPDLADTYAYTSMYRIPNTNKVSHIEVRIQKGLETTLSHEVGHCLSNYKDNLYWWCYQPIFEQIWMLERYNNTMMAQGWNDVREYFACAYDLYIRYPELLKRTCPMTYNYITVVLNYT